MTQILVRDLETETVNSLKLLAKMHNRSLTSEVKHILEGAALRVSYEPAKLAAAIRKKNKKKQKSDSVQLVNGDRGR